MESETVDGGTMAHPLSLTYLEMENSPLRVS